jgi:hypothetical protein
VNANLTFKEHVQSILIANGLHSLEVVGDGTTSTTVRPVSDSAEWPHMASKITAALKRSSLIVEPRAGYLYVRA